MLSELLLDQDYLVDVAHDGQHGLRRGRTGGCNAVRAHRPLPVNAGAQLAGLLRSRGIHTLALLPARRDVELSQPEAALLAVLLCAPHRKLGRGIVRSIHGFGYRLGVE